MQEAALADTRQAICYMHALMRSVDSLGRTVGMPLGL
jgi:hypothetical protein